MRLLWIAIGTLLWAGAALGDEPEEVLTRARGLVKEKKAAQAIDLLSRHCDANPKDLDARVLHGLILSWEGRYDEGRKSFEAVLAADPDYKDARMGLINLERWSGNASRAAELAIEGLQKRPRDAEYEEFLKKALRDQEERTRKSAAAVSGSLAASAEAKSEARWEFGVDANQIRFSDRRPVWNEQSFILGKNTQWGWVNGRLQRAEQGGTRSNLLELEMYPRIRKGLYGLVSGGFSPDFQLFAKRRFAGELFQSVPRGFEISGGYRYFRFVNTVHLATGSVAKYFGNWWVASRVFVSPGSAGASRSVQFLARRYFRDADHYIGFRGGYGASPFEVRSINETGILDSESTGFEALWKFHNGLRMRANAGLARQARQFSNQYLWLYSTGVTLYYGM